MWPEEASGLHTTIIYPCRLVFKVPSCVWGHLRECGCSMRANRSVLMHKRQRSSFITVKRTLIDFAQLRDSTLAFVSPFTLMGSAWINNATNPTVFISAPSLLLLLFQSFKAPLSRIKDWRGAEAPRVTATEQFQRRFSSFLTKKLKKSNCLDALLGLTALIQGNWCCSFQHHTT